MSTFSNIDQKQITSWEKSQGGLRGKTDWITREEPLEIRLVFGFAEQRTQRALAVTMRSPGQDRELAAGFVFTEGIIASLEDIEQLRYRPHFQQSPEENLLELHLRPGVSVELKHLKRHFYTTSSCGVCGKASLEAVATQLPPTLPAPRWFLSPEVLTRLPATLRKTQSAFQQTGSLHATASFDPQGNLQLLFEDVGRHNAMDKLIGHALLQDQLPLRQKILLVSGRLSFELVQKALMAGAECLAAIGAPSSLAIDLAKENGMTLIGFLKPNRFNVYSGEDRILFE